MPKPSRVSPTSGSTPHDRAVTFSELQAATKLRSLIDEFQRDYPECTRGRKLHPAANFLIVSIIGLGAGLFVFTLGTPDETLKVGLAFIAFGLIGATITAAAAASHNARYERYQELVREEAALMEGRGIHNEILQRQPLSKRRTESRGGEGSIVFAVITLICYLLIYPLGLVLNIVGLLTGPNRGCFVQLLGLFVLLPLAVLGVCLYLGVELLRPLLIILGID